VTTTIALYVILPAFMWAGGADVPDAVYDWRLQFVSASDYSLAGAYPGTFASRNQCDTNRRSGAIAPPPGAYLACLPTLKPSGH
jgi:hypothetical protein